MVKLNEVRGFIKKQSHNYRMILVRSAGSNFLMNLTRNYFSIYTTGLGANAITLGGIRSISATVNMIISLPSGWLSDNYNLKKVMGVGMAIQVVMVTLLALARDWTWVLVSMSLDPFTMALMFRSQTVMMSNALKDGDRATGFGLRQIFGQLVGITAPIPAALIVGYFGGLNVEGIRPLFHVRTIGLALLYAMSTRGSMRSPLNPDLSAREAEPLHGVPEVDVLPALRGDGPRSSDDHLVPVHP